MKNEHQLLYIWDNRDEKIEYSAFRNGYNAIAGVEGGDGFQDAVTILLASKLIVIGAGEFSITKKGWKIREKTSAPSYLKESIEESDKRLDEINNLEVSIKKRAGLVLEEPSIALSQKESPWHWFRRLVGYYIECVRRDERPNNVLYKDSENKNFIPINLAGYWWPIESREEVTLNFPVRDDQLSFLRHVVMEEDFFIGYPVHILGEGDKRVAIPVFCIPIDRIDYELDKISVVLNFENADVNSSWLERRFRTNAEKSTFLQRCGLMDDDTSLSDIDFDFVKAVNAVKIFAADHVVQKLDPLITDPIYGITNRSVGIHNSALVFTGQKVTFSAGLIKELEMIRKVPDEDLEKTALKYVFSDYPNDVLSDEPTIENKQHAIPFVPFNEEQEGAVNSALEKKFTVITGPPGTGKSQVVVNILANMAIQGKTALFASRNHKAIDAVVPRTNNLLEESQIIARLKNPETGEEFTWKKAINRVLEATSRPKNENIDRLKSEVEDLLIRRNDIIKAAELWSNEEQKLSKLNERIDSIKRGLLPSQIRAIEEKDDLVFDQLITKLNKIFRVIPKRPSGLFGTIHFYFWKFFHQKKDENRIRDLRIELETYDLDLAEFHLTEEFKTSLKGSIEKLSLMEELSKLSLRSRKIEDNIKQIQPIASCTDEIIGLYDEIKIKAPEILEKSISNRFSQLEQHELRDLQQLRVIAGNLSNASVGLRTTIKWNKFFNDKFSDLLKFFPMWAVSNLSVRKGLPLIPGIMDQVIIDEASQCDVASIIPLLFRAKSAVIVGDGNQLRPVYKISSKVSMRLFEKYKLTDDPKNLVYQFGDEEINAFSIAASSPRVDSKILLRDHYRCHQDIALYFNNQFYGQDLRAYTCTDNLSVPNSYKPGVKWTDITGNIERVGGKSAICRAEIEAVVDEIKNILIEHKFEGSVGVVSPFAKQAERIRDAAYAEIPIEKLKEAEFVSSTAHGFQGDEKDVILISTMLQPDMYRGGEWFTQGESSANLWNVAASRARAILHVFGNKEVCLNSTAKHLRYLVERCLSESVEVDRHGSFDSEWERIFYNALKKAGIETVSQYPLAGKRLDLAIPSLKIDIEVDGEKFHKDKSGMRKSEDLWRDMTIRANGWTPVRFWVYELREEMDRCVKEVKNKIEELSE